MKIYIATSWKNEELAKLIAQILRKDGHEVDCFCDPSTGRFCFKWQDHFGKIEDMNMFNFLALPEARKAFREDKKWIDWCEALVMIYPCGNSAHLEGGYAKGKGKMFYIWGEFPDGYFENMYGFADGIFGPDDLPKLRKALQPKMTNEEYEKKRNSLIPEAEKFADDRAGSSAFRSPESHGRKRWGFEWNKVFHNKMNELARDPFE